MVHGLDKAKEAAKNRSGRGWLKLEVDKPTEITIISYEGEVESKFKSDDGQVRYNHRWKVRHEEVEKNLDGPWRMNNAIVEAIKDFGDDEEAPITITKKQVIEEIKNKDGSTRKALVNSYEVAPF